MSRDDFLLPTHLTGPPRRVPLSVRIRLLLGNFVGQIGWFFLGFGMVFVWVVVEFVDVSELWTFRGQLQTAGGTVTEVIDTKSKVNDSPVYGYRYEYEVDGRTLTGLSYTTGRSFGVGTQVEVEFPPGRPERSRIVGTSTAAVPVFVMFVVIFPIIGMFMATYSLQSGMRGNRLLKNGVVGRGRLISKERTNVRINDRTVYKLTFEFLADDGQLYTTYAKTHETKKLLDEAEEPLLYNPHNPADAVMLDALPGSPRIDAGGEIQRGNPLATAAALVVPTATVVGHGLYYYWRTFGG